jgi:hypothetical protein
MGISYPVGDGYGRNFVPEVGFGYGDGDGSMFMGTGLGSQSPTGNSPLTSLFSSMSQAIPSNARRLWSALMATLSACCRQCARPTPRRMLPRTRASTWRREDDAEARCERTGRVRVGPNTRRRRGRPLSGAVGMRQWQVRGQEEAVVGAR